MILALSTSRHRSSTFREWQCTFDGRGGVSVSMLALTVVFSVVVVTKLAMEGMAVFRRSVGSFSSSLRDGGWVNQISSHSKLIVSLFLDGCIEYSTYRVAPPPLMRSPVFSSTFFVFFVSV